MDGEIDSRQLIVPGLAGFYQRLAPYSYALIRFATGAILVPHGVQKILTAPIARYAGTIGSQGLPFPELLAYLTYFSESVAALFIAIGLCTRPAAAIVGIEMFVVALVFQSGNGYFWTRGGYEYPLLLALLCVGIFFRGGGRYSLDHVIGREL